MRFRAPIPYLILFLLNTATHCHAQQWRWRSRIDFSLLHDNNVLEQLTETAGDEAARFQLDLSGGFRHSNSLLFSLKYKGGIEGYRQYHAESRTVHDGSALAELNLGSRTTAGLILQGKAKQFFQSNRGYWLPRFSPFVRVNLSNGLRATLFYDYSYLNYSAGDFFDTGFSNMGFTLTHRPFPEIAIDLTIRKGKLNFNRNAFQYSVVDSVVQWNDLGVEQSDEFTAIALRCQLYYWALWEIRFSYQNHTSNSYGYAYNLPEVEFIFAKGLPLKFILRFYGTLQWKNYSDDLEPLLQVRPDSEYEESSFVVLDLSRDISKKTSLALRVGWYNNESPFRDFYYRKTLTSIGLTKRF